MNQMKGRDKYNGHKICCLLLAVSLLSLLPGCGGRSAGTEVPSPGASVSGRTADAQVNQAQEGAAEQVQDAGYLYLGVEGYGSVDAEQKDDFRYLFSKDGTTVRFLVRNDGDYTIQNQLMEGSRYDLTVEGETVTAAQPSRLSAAGLVEAVDDQTITVDGTVFQLSQSVNVSRISTAAGGASEENASAAVGDSVRLYGDPVAQIDLCTTADDYTAPVSGEPGVHTLKNFLATALQPVGTTLYVYGGGWDWQDENSSVQSTTIGLPEAWRTFFLSQTEDYTYKNESDEAHSYYPFHAWNEYYYAGADCSGYVGWVLYNVMNTQSGGAGYVTASTGLAKGLAEQYGYGSWTQDAGEFRPGDIVSIKGHVWICLGACADGSLVILHSTPTDSVTSRPGGGVQISGLGTNADCQAAQLAKQYMQTYYPAWSERYTAVCKDYAAYTTFEGEKAGVFHWALEESGLSDPDGFAAMSAEEILRTLFDSNK